MRRYLSPETVFVHAFRFPNDDAIPALLVSGDTDPARLIEAAARSIPVLHKPVEVDALRTWVEKLLVAGTAPQRNP